eukprot:Rmarinus@m.14057
MAHQGSPKLVSLVPVSTDFEATPPATHPPVSIPGQEEEFSVPDLSQDRSLDTCPQSADLPPLSFPLGLTRMYVPQTNAAFAAALAGFVPPGSAPLHGIPISGPHARMVFAGANGVGEGGEKKDKDVMEAADMLLLLPKAPMSQSSDQGPSDVTATADTKIKCWTDIASQILSGLVPGIPSGARIMVPKPDNDASSMTSMSMSAPGLVDLPLSGNLISRVGSTTGEDGISATPSSHLHSLLRASQPGRSPLEKSEGPPETATSIATASPVPSSPGPADTTANSEASAHTPTQGTQVLSKGSEQADPNRVAQTHPNHVDRSCAVATTLSEKTTLSTAPRAVGKKSKAWLSGGDVAARVEPKDSPLAGHAVTSQTDSLPFRCSVCDYATTQKSSLHKHIRLKHPDHKLLHKCEYCTFTCANSSELVVHVYKSHKPFTCHLCDYATGHSGHLKQHIQQRHSQEKPFKCKFCDYACVRKNSLDAHVRSKHTGEKPFKCDQCDYAAAQFFSLQLHMRRKHTGDKPYTCPHCPYATTQSSHLKSHIRNRHFLEKPFRCAHCHYAAATAANLQAHTKTKHREAKTFWCRYCNAYACKTASALSGHQRTCPQTPKSSSALDDSVEDNGGPSVETIPSAVDGDLSLPVAPLSSPPPPAHATPSTTTGSAPLTATDPSTVTNKDAVAGPGVPSSVGTFASQLPGPNPLKGSGSEVTMEEQRLGLSLVHTHPHPQLAHMALSVSSHQAHLTQQAVTHAAAMNAAFAATAAAIRSNEEPSRIGVDQPSRLGVDTSASPADPHSHHNQLHPQAAAALPRTPGHYHGGTQLSFGPPALLVAEPSTIGPSSPPMAPEPSCTPSSAAAPPSASQPRAQSESHTHSHTQLLTPETLLSETLTTGPVPAESRPSLTHPHVHAQSSAMLHGSTAQPPASIPQTPYGALPHPLLAQGYSLNPRVLSMLAPETVSAAFSAILAQQQHQQSFQTHVPSQQPPPFQQQPPPFQQPPQQPQQPSSQQQQPHPFHPPPQRPQQQSFQPQPLHQQHQQQPPLQAFQPQAFHPPQAFQQPSPLVPLHTSHRHAAADVPSGCLPQKGPAEGSGQPHNAPVARTPQNSRKRSLEPTFETEVSLCESPSCEPRQLTSPSVDNPSSSLNGLDEGQGVVWVTHCVPEKRRKTCDTTPVERFCEGGDGGSSTACSSEEER